MTEKKQTTHPFNNFIETGLRMMALLNAAHPLSLDLQTLLYLDYLSVHSGDIPGGLKSLHPAVPTRKGEIFVRRKLIDDSLNFLEAKGLVVKLFDSTGIMFKATEYSTPFLENLSEKYTSDLLVRAQWVVERFKSMEASELSAYMNKFITVQSENFDFNFLSNG